MHSLIARWWLEDVNLSSEAAPGRVLAPILEVYSLSFLDLLQALRLLLLLQHYCRSDILRSKIHNFILKSSRTSVIVSYKVVVLELKGLSLSFAGRAGSTAQNRLSWLVSSYIVNEVTQDSSWGAVNALRKQRVDSPLITELRILSHLPEGRPSTMASDTQQSSLLLPEHQRKVELTGRHRL